MYIHCNVILSVLLQQKQCISLLCWCYELIPLNKLYSIQNCCHIVPGMNYNITNFCFCSTLAPLLEWRSFKNFKPHGCICTCTIKFRFMQGAPRTSDFSIINRSALLINFFVQENVPRKFWVFFLHIDLNRSSLISLYS